jgi:hypothetical protein
MSMQALALLLKSAIYNFNGRSMVKFLRPSITGECNLIQYLNPMRRMRLFSNAAFRIECTIYDGVYFAHKRK